MTHEDVDKIEVWMDRVRPWLERTCITSNCLGFLLTVDGEQYLLAAIFFALLVWVIYDHTKVKAKK